MYMYMHDFFNLSYEKKYYQVKYDVNCDPLGKMGKLVSQITEVIKKKKKTRKKKLT